MNKTNSYKFNYNKYLAGKMEKFFFIYGLEG